MNDTTTFDAAGFLNQTVDEPMATSVEMVPEGEYQATIDTITEKSFRRIDWNDKDTGEPRSAPMFEPMFVIQGAEDVKKELGRDKLMVPAQGMFLDLNDAGGLDTGKGKNVMLGQIRDAVGQNGGGQWTFGNLSGAGPLMIYVKHVADKKDPSIKRARVTRVAKIS